MYEVLKHKANIWEVGMNKKDWSTEIVQLHQVSAEFKPIRQIVEWRDALKDAMNFKMPRKRKHKDVDGLLWVIPHTDIHFDKYSNPDNYLKEIDDRTFDIFNLLRKNGVEHLVYANMGDYFNTDGKYKTTKGTEQFNSMSEKEAFKMWLKHQIDLLNEFSKDMNVDALYVSGNHDDLKLQALSDSMELYFENNGRVNIDSEDKYRKYYEFGDTTIGFWHWDWVKEKDILSVMSQEQWLNVNNYYLKWHIHHQLKQAYGNLIIQTLESPSNPWEWDNKMWYIGKGKLVGQAYDKKDWKIVEIYK